MVQHLSALPVSASQSRNEVCFYFLLMPGKAKQEQNNSFYDMRNHLSLRKYPLKKGISKEIFNTIIFSFMFSEQK